MGSWARRKPQKGSVCVFAGVVYSYDQEGVHRDGRGWEQCISIPLLQPDMWELLQHWDSLLEEFSLEEAWLPHRCVLTAGVSLGWALGSLRTPFLAAQPGLPAQNVLKFKGNSAAGT